MGIQLHIITPTEQLALDTQKDTKNVVGFNSNRVLQLSDSRKHTNIGSTDLRSHLTYGPDLGIDIQNENDGYTFSLTNYQKLEAPKRKTFVAVASAAIAEQITQTETEYDCQCKFRRVPVATEFCIASGTKSVTPVAVIIFKFSIRPLFQAKYFKIQMSFSFRKNPIEDKRALPTREKDRDS